MIVTPSVKLNTFLFLAFLSMRFCNMALALLAAVQLTPVWGTTAEHSGSLWMEVNIGSYEFAARLIQEGVDVNEAKDGMTPLYEAALRGRLDLVELLLGNGANTQLARRGGITPFLIAAKHGHVDIVRRLAEHEASPDSFENAMLFAAANGRLDVVEYLLEKDANLANARNNAGFTSLDLTVAPQFTSTEIDSPCALTMASSKGYLDVVSALVHHGAKVDYYALAAACSGGYIRIIDFLIEHGADVNEAHPRDGQSFPITDAVNSGRIDVLELLIRRGATRGLDEALMLYRSRHNFMLTKFLIEHGADPNFSKPPLLRTRLIVAVQDDRRDIIRLLLDHGADLRPDHAGLTPLDLAISSGQPALVDLLVEAGAVKDLPVPARAQNNQGMMRRLILGGASNSVVSLTFYQELMRPINMIKSAVPALANNEPMQAYNQAYLGLRRNYQTFTKALLTFAFLARKEGGMDLFSDPEVRGGFFMYEKKLGMLASIVNDLAYLGCSDLNFFYTVAVFLLEADEDMLRHAEAAFKFLAGSFGSPQEKERHRATNGAILNEMIERSNHIGLRPVVKALFTIYHEESQIRRSFRSWGFQSVPRDSSTTQVLPDSLIDLVMSYDNGIFNPQFKAKAMQKLTQAIRRLR